MRNANCTTQPSIKRPLLGFQRLNFGLGHKRIPSLQDAKFQIKDKKEHEEGRRRWLGQAPKPNSSLAARTRGLRRPKWPLYEKNRSDTGTDQSQKTAEIRPENLGKCGLFIRGRKVFEVATDFAKTSRHSKIHSILGPDRSDFARNCLTAQDSSRFSFDHFQNAPPVSISFLPEKTQRGIPGAILSI